MLKSVDSYEALSWNFATVLVNMKIRYEIKQKTIDELLPQVGESVKRLQMIQYYHRTLGTASRSETV